jgi:class 3 adenylate cyclase/tetratricopeptide (TPR) repeat protein
MKCVKCQSENREGVKFCEECGAKIELVCPGCGVRILGDKKFCGECGYDLKTRREPTPINYSQPQSYTPKFLEDKILTSRSTMEGERKLVTVLFADVANFTTLSEKLDAEEVHMIMDGCFQLLMDEIHKFEGTINQFTGDGVMALFGAPLAHEDHANRACHAALSIQRSLGEYGEKVARDYGVEFKMRIGVNSGPVIVGAIGDDLRMDYTAVGDTTNLASRMESMARPSSVLLSQNTHRLVKDYFDVKSLGKVEVKGKSEPQEVFELVKAGGAATRIEASVARGLTKFVGREKDMAALMEAFEKVKNGAGQVVGIVGEAGVGKSRLLLEFKKRPVQGEFTYLEGRCIHYGGAIPYLPILNALGTYFGLVEGERETLVRKRVTERVLGLDDNLADILAPIQELLSLKVEDEGYLQLEPKQRKERIFEGLRNLLIRTSQERPLVLAVEDLHWVDKTTEEFLDYIIGWVANVNILLILLHRPEYTHRWGSKSYFNRIGVDQLTLKSSAELVRAILEGGEAAPELNAIILNRAAGNPLFMEELTQTLLENGFVGKEQDQYILVRKVSELQTPDTVQGIIAARIDRLEENLKNIMQVAAVIGREFAFRILQSTVGMREELKTHLLNLQGLEFIYEKSLFPELEYIFKHSLTQEVAYNSLLSSRRRDIHKRIGSAIEELYADRLEEFYEMLAYHYSNSDDSVRAVHYLKLSGGKAMSRYSPVEAFRFYKDALGVLKRMPGTIQNKKEQIGVMLSIGDSARILSFPEDSFELLQEGEALCSDLGDKRSSALIHSYLGMYYSSKRGNAPLGMKFQQDAFEAAEDLQDNEIMIQIGANLCLSYDFAGEYRKIVQAAPKVIALLEKAPKKFEFFDTLVDLHPLLIALYGHALGYVGKFTQGEKECEKALILAQQGGNPYSLGWAEFMFGCQYIPKGDGEKAVKHLQNSIVYFEKLQAVSPLQVAWSLLAQGYNLLGQSGKAAEYLQKMLKLQADIKSPGFLSLGHLALSSAHLNSGHLNEAKVHAEQALNLGQANNEKYCEGLGWIQLGRIIGKMEASRIDEAEEFMLNGMKILKDLETKPAYATGCFSLCELYLKSGRIEKGLEVLRRCEEMFSRMGMDHWVAQARNVLSTINRSLTH